MKDLVLGKSTDGTKLPKLGLKYITKILDLNRFAFIDQGVTSGYTEEIPLVNVNALKRFGTLVLGIKGRTYWKKRPTILVEMAGKQTIKDETAKSFKVRIRGYVLIDEYTGSVVLRDIIRELYDEPNAEMFEREAYKVDLDPTTPTSTDQFVLKKEKAAQL